MARSFLHGKGMFRSLTFFQQALIKDYKKLARAVYFHGIDQNELPVISYADDNGEREPFALRPRAIRVPQFTGFKSVELIPRERTVTEPAYPLRWFTELELDHIDPDSHELLSNLQRKIVLT